MNARVQLQKEKSLVVILKDIGAKMNCSQSNPDSVFEGLSLAASCLQQNLSTDIQLIESI
jgi:hypothetical protein